MLETLTCYYLFFVIVYCSVVYCYSNTHTHTYLYIHKVYRYYIVLVGLELKIFLPQTPGYLAMQRYITVPSILASLEGAGGWE